MAEETHGKYFMVMFYPAFAATSPVANPARAGFWFTNERLK